MVVKFTGTPSMGEGLGGNINPMKVLPTDLGEFAYLSPSSIFKQPLMEYFVKEKKWVLEFGKNVNIPPKKRTTEKPPLGITSFADEDPFADIFGYLFTRKKDKKEKSSNNEGVEESAEMAEETRKRKSPLGVSYAVSLMGFKNCSDYRSNLGLVDLSGSKGEGQMIFQREIDMNYFVYTINLDLQRIGKEENKNENNEVDIEEKLKRVQAILEAIPYVAIQRNGSLIGTLNPHLIVGGVFEKKFPYFIDSIVWDKTRNAIMAKAINDIIDEYELKSDDNNLLVFGIREGFPIEGKVKIDSLLPKKAIDRISDFISKNKDKIWKK
ncbi:MAG TPA: type I-B CRISPR-associated protein Cas7/Cst2/DevR [Candidatus Ratteibacteria bacterium]|nr:type I-B CRISPR-associated protein Cas7/Cst2/DevR [bacterium]HRS05417.1 type I-B CRISPR-associated protein Cas7/Cst2/DevR [Candidatus Ratteibacteria bacterium]HRV04291.1 type I-B CRISPR-associated protein Cas7/Cst2/DevR [Candidatus Ratteibacteria bacterium]